MKSGNGNRRHVSNLSDRDLEIVDLAFRYRVVTNAMIKNQLFAEHQPNAVTKVTSRLVNSGWLRRHAYLHGKDYFTVGERFVLLQGIPTSKTRPLGIQTLAIAIAISDVCLLLDRRLQVLTQDLIQTDWGWMPPSLRAVRFLQFQKDSVAQPQLWMVRVDLGGSSSHVANKCMVDWKRVSNSASIQSLLLQRRFSELIITTSEHKRLLIATELQKRSWPAGTRFEFLVSRELVNTLGFA